MAIKLGSECHACKKEINPFEIQYNCYFCKIWFCVECADKIDETKLGTQSFIHPHNLILINVSNDECLNEIGVLRLGENVAFESNVQDSGSSCNACGSLIEGYRFICLNCKPGPRIGYSGMVDLCQKCMMAILHRT